MHDGTSSSSIDLYLIKCFSNVFPDKDQMLQHASQYD